MSRTKALLELNQASERRSLELAAANFSNWKPVSPLTPPSPWEAKNAAASEQIDIAIMDLMDLAPERFSWQVLALCEVIITSKSGTAEHVEAMSQLMQLTPPFLHKDAVDALTRLMLNAGRRVVSFDKPDCAERSRAHKLGWILV